MYISGILFRARNCKLTLINKLYSNSQNTKLEYANEFYTILSNKDGILWKEWMDGGEGVK